MTIKLGYFTMFILFLAIGSYSLYCQYGPFAVNKELNNIIKSQDINAIDRVSADSATKDFLMNLPINTRADRTTDFQGGTPKAQIYNTLLNGRSIEVVIKEDNHSSLYLRLFPKWSIISLHLRSN